MGTARPPPWLKATSSRAKRASTFPDYAAAFFRGALLTLRASATAA